MVVDYLSGQPTGTLGAVCCRDEARAGSVRLHLEGFLDAPSPGEYWSGLGGLEDLHIFGVQQLVRGGPSAERLREVPLPRLSQSSSRMPMASSDNRRLLRNSANLARPLEMSGRAAAHVLPRGDPTTHTLSASDTHGGNAPRIARLLGHPYP